MAAQPRHLHRLLALFDPLLRRTSLVVEPYHRPTRQTQVRNDKAYSREQLALVMLHFGHHSAGLIPARCLVEKTLVLDQGFDAGPPHRARQQLGDVPFQVLVGWNANGVASAFAIRSRLIAHRPARFSGSASSSVANDCKREVRAAPRS